MLTRLQIWALWVPVSHVPFVVITIGSFLHPWLITGFVTRVTRPVSHVEQELLIPVIYVTCLTGVGVVQWCQIICLHVFISVLWCLFRFPQRNDVRFVLIPIFYVGCSCFLYVICIYLHILVSIRISISDDVRLVQQSHEGCHMWTRNN